MPRALYSVKDMGHLKFVLKALKSIDLLIPAASSHCAFYQFKATAESKIN
jgi:hypothetical protein